jgi:hypothetical protein
MGPRERRACLHGAILQTPTRTWDATDSAFVPLRASLETTLEITNATASTIDLVLTFAPLTALGSGVSRVAALQSVYSGVSVNFTTDASLYWLVSALPTGELEPNQAGQMFDSNTDTFSLQVTQDITVDHDADGWTIPTYDDAEYTVYVGFGLKIRGWVYWAYSVSCTPGQRVDVAPGSYQLVPWNGQEQIGDAVFVTGMTPWSMPMGYDYELDFDETGTGVLRTISADEAGAG